ncbi:pyridoxal-phosphate dependent enzyme [Nordella sp. HKS 07]|uniref:threonine synthase n=1 Tax=Nordella sp. HKS 07 TaxID=2712222 RepID=UPI0013E14412|nr:pyridoxal-phosphate dependent enzyme [Nordella sp. HKS 07]QIG46647.1 pyridoxal-phosphate dependent enzyme [Nordella sp. HKS 07]
MTNALEWVNSTRSLARRQRSLGPGSAPFNLYPPKTDGDECLEYPGPYPLEIEFDLSNLPAGYFARQTTSGLEQWQEILPALAPQLSLGEGGTPLIESRSLGGWAGCEVLVKDESRNPTFSHKDRLNLCTISAALAAGAPGIAVASSGNHGASAAAYAARAGIPCILITANGTSAGAQAFMRAYGAAVVSVPVETRRELLLRVVRETGYMPVSSVTERHTGNPFGPEGYKTISYELFCQLGQKAPAAVFAPTGYAELLFGLWKGFNELKSFGLIKEIPQIVACEPAARAPLAKAVGINADFAEVEAAPTNAFAIACTISSWRGHLSVSRSGGFARAVSDEEIADACAESGKAGLWPEFSAAAALAGVKQAVAAGRKFEGPVVAIQTSCGFKDPPGPGSRVPEIEPTFSALRSALSKEYGVRI